MKNLNKEIIFTFKWYKKLTKRFLDLAFIQTIIVVIVTLFSQLFMLLSSLMPLKVIMLLGSDNVPKYFPNSWQTLDRDILIIYLAIASFGFFILYLLSEKIITIYSYKGSDKILQNNQKIVLFEKQDIFAQNSYTKLSKSLSNIIFFILALIGLGILYPLISIVILVFLFSVYIVFYKIDANENLNNLLNLAKGIGFFVVFTFILGSFIADFYPPRIIIVILSVLLIRQMFLKLNDAIKYIVNLYKNRQKINSLFFFGHTKVQISHESKDPFWSMFETNTRKKWIEKLLNNMFDDNISYVSSQWYKINIKNVAYLKVTLKYDNSDETNMFLLKLFNKNISSQAIHEATLLEEYCDGLFSLPFVGSTVVEEFHCNIFNYKDIEQMTQKVFNTHHIMIRTNMMNIELPNELINRYNRSHPYLYKRLNKQIFYKLYLVIEDEEIEMIKSLEKNFDSIINKIQKLPLQIINPLVTKFNLVQREDNLLLLHWGRWKIDSIGVDFPVGVKQIDILKKHFKILRNKKNEFLNVEINDVILASLMANFEKLCKGENFTGVVNIVPRILECLKDEK